MGEKIVEIIIEMFEVAEWFENRPYQSLPPVALQRNQLVARDTGKGESGRRIETCFEPFSNLSAGSFDAMCGGDGAVGFANAAGRFDEGAGSVEKYRFDRHNGEVPNLRANCNHANMLYNRNR